MASPKLVSVPLPEIPEPDEIGVQEGEVVPFGAIGVDELRLDVGLDLGEKRIETAVAWMAEGKPRNWKYMKEWR